MQLQCDAAATNHAGLRQTTIRCRCRCARTRALARAVELIVGITAACLVVTKAVAIPFDFSSNKIYVPARVNGHGPFSFIVDTGSIAMVVDNGCADSVGIRSRDRFDVHGAGDGALSASSASNIDFNVGDAALAKQQINVMPINTAISRSEGRRVDGLLGCPFFENFIVEIDYARREINFWRRQSAIPTSTVGDTLAIELERGNIFTRANIILPDGEKITGRFVVDTGWRSAISLSTSFARDHRIAQRVHGITATAGVGIGGPVTASISRLKGLEFGSTQLEQPIVDVAQSGAGFLNEENFAGVVGAEVLRRFRVVLDYPHRRMFLQPNESIHEPFEFDMSGMYLLADGQDFHSFRIASVTAGSPAAETGLRANDIIETINDRPSASFTLEELRRLLRKEPGELTLKVRRGNDVRTVRLRLRRLV